MKIEHVKREVIEQNLLAALDNKEKVAILCTKDDLDMLIDALKDYEAMCKDDGELQEAREKARQYWMDLTKLRQSAFK